MKVWLSFGSNLGNREANIRAAAERIGARLSNIIETDAIDHEGKPVDQPKYLNAVGALETDLGPRELLAQILDIERSLGRNPDEKGRYLPRTIDIDILTIENVSINEPDLIIPHPRLADRPFLTELLSALEAESPQSRRK